MRYIFNLVLARRIFQSIDFIRDDELIEIRLLFSGTVKILAIEKHVDIDDVNLERDMRQ